MTTDLIGTEIEALSSSQDVDVQAVLNRLTADAAVSDDAVATRPTPSIITDEERDALARLPELFGQVCPTAPAPLTTDEADALLAERTLLATVEKLAKTRKDDIRAIVSNALDAVLTESGDADDDTPRDTHGWFLVPGEVAGASNGRFVRTVRRGSASVDLDRLRELADDPDCELLDHDDWLALTRQTRVFDEAKAALVLRDKPELLRALAEATVPGTASTVINQRKK